MTISIRTWPKADESKTLLQKVKIAASVNGKVRDVLEVDKGTDEATLQGLALALPKIKAYTDGHTIKKVIVVKDRIINIVVA